MSEHVEADEEAAAEVSVVSAWSGELKVTVPVEVPTGPITAVMAAARPVRLSPVWKAKARGEAWNSERGHFSAWIVPSRRRDRDVDR